MLAWCPPSQRVPSRGLLVTEPLRAGLDAAALAAAWPMLMTARRGDGHAVLVLPGWLTGDPTTAPLRFLLRALGHNVSGWSLGRNRGPTGRIVRELRSRLDRLYRSSGRRVSLVGWSLGGLYAQELARAAPGSIRGIVTLGSPVTRRAPWVRTASDIVDRGTRLPRGVTPCPGPGPNAAHSACLRRRSTPGRTASCIGRRAGTSSGLGGRTSRYGVLTWVWDTTQRCCGCWLTGSGCPRGPGLRSGGRLDSARCSPAVGDICGDSRGRQAARIRGSCGPLGIADRGAAWKRIQAC